MSETAANYGRILRYCNNYLFDSQGETVGETVLKQFGTKAKAAEFSTGFSTDFAGRLATDKTYSRINGDFPFPT